MLTSLQIKNFKQLKDVEIELGQSVVFVGPNNSGKTTALQALALWHIGLRHWLAGTLQGKFPAGNQARQIELTDLGMSINRLDIVPIPVPNADLLWTNLEIAENNPIIIELSGVGESTSWTCGFVFRLGNPESLYVMPAQRKGSTIYVPTQAKDVIISLLPPMSGLTATEDRWETGSINRRIGEGRTAEVLRNLCFRVYEQGNFWQALVDEIKSMFGIELLPPDYLPARGEIRMAYHDSGGTLLDISSAGRGMHQILLLLSYMYLNPGTVILLDEPDAHLEILRQEQIYKRLTDIAFQQQSQVIIATHSEKILNAAGDRDILIAFIGKPHRIDDRSSKAQVAKALKEVGFEKYYQAEQVGWTLFLEGSTDLSILQAFAQILDYQDAIHALVGPFVEYVGNTASQVGNLFFALREAKPDLVAYALFDNDANLPDDLLNNPYIATLKWERQEIENYLMFPDVLTAYAYDKFKDAGRDIMQQLIVDNVPPAALNDLDHRWWRMTKATDQFLDPLFSDFFKTMSLPNLLRKTDYHILAHYLNVEQIPTEVTEKLEQLANVASRAKPYRD